MPKSKPPSLTSRPSVALMTQRQQASIFAILWALAHIGHVLRKGHPSDQLAWLVVVAAVLVVARPDSSRRIAALCIFQLLLLYSKLPGTDNHLVILGFANLGILISVLGLTLRRPRRSQEYLGHPISEALPFLRLSIILAYAAAALAKLNSGFFNLEESCAVTMTQDALAVFGDGILIPGSVKAILPATVAGFELAIPLLLLVPRTRAIGVITVVVFHLAMSLSPTATAGDFTFMLFALVFLFLPSNSSEFFVGLARQVRDSVRHGIRRIWFRTLAPAALLMTLAVLVAERGHRAFTLMENQNWLLVASMGVLLGGLLVVAAWRALREGTRSDATLIPQRWWLYAPVILLLLANAGAPYVGSKTISVFTMYSNLQTEAQTSNHYLFPRFPRHGSADDLVLIEATSNDRLQEIGARGELITWHELRRELASDPAASIRFTRDGETFEYEVAAEDPELVSTDWPAHRLVQHRLFDPDRAPCRW